MPQPLPRLDWKTRADVAACRAMLRGGSRSFYAASFLLPQGVRDPATALYAFCRLADDEIDLNNGRGDALERLQERLDRIYDQRPHPIAADRAFASVVEAFAIPRALPEALLEGFAWDANGRRYETIEDVYAYSARVAGTVGAMMSLLMGARSSELMARACDLGVAMQLTNISRDVGEDARNGRLYLPEQWLREAEIDPDEWLSNPVFNEGIQQVIKRLLETADALYERADTGIAGLPRACRPGIYAARYLYAEIGREVERLDYDSISQRAVVSGKRKASRLRDVILSTLVAQTKGALPPLAETRFLVDAVEALDAVADSKRQRFSTAGRVERVIGLFERLERREREQQLARIRGRRFEQAHEPLTQAANG